MKLKIVTSKNKTAKEFEDEINDFMEGKSIHDLDITGFIGYAPRAYITYDEKESKEPKKGRLVGGLTAKLSI